MCESVSSLIGFDPQIKTSLDIVVSVKSPLVPTLRETIAKNESQFPAEDAEERRRLRSVNDTRKQRHVPNFRCLRSSANSAGSKLQKSKVNFPRRYGGPEEQRMCSVNDEEAGTYHQLSLSPHLCLLCGTQIIVLNPKPDILRGNYLLSGSFRLWPNDQP